MGGCKALAVFQRLPVVSIMHWITVRIYTLAEHTNFAPHVSGGVLSLANCMPALRAGARVGEWVAGVTPVRMGLSLAYLMRVNAVFTRAQYFQKFGRTRLDSIYKPLVKGGWHQYVNPWHGEPRRAYDLGVDRVLLSGTFFNFSAGYDGWQTTPTGLALPTRYAALLGKSVRGAGWFRSVPFDFIPWATSQPTVSLGTIDAWERQLP